MKLHTSTFLFFVVFCVKAQQNQPVKQIICGYNLVSPKQKSNLAGMDSIAKHINPNWVSISTYAFIYQDNSSITYNSPKNWWGDTEIGFISAIKKAQKQKLKVMLKPQLWLINNGWAGNFELFGIKKVEWEKNYSNYLIYLCKICDSLKVDMICIGTELKTYTSKHPNFFVGMIQEIKKHYQGKLTYAANWDEYQSINFWSQLDYIGIDAYFPLSTAKTPSVLELEKKWKIENTRLKKFSEKWNKKIIFTEYGYKSIDYAANKQWEFENTPVTEKVNVIAQNNSYTALYNSVWNQTWFAGGFIWKCFEQHKIAGGPLNSDYTPQNKPVQKIIKSWYTK